ncbi:transmembrane protein 94 [Rhipicephalus sanguineus]|uniref:transmembrane protein 94 n=1 Tax=Rhipicephalus sanguineus TaxID=34632 RepID=UPI0020C30F94|nr:transmembrane protein 94 [Rhipicephalus sanguineus]
MEPAGLTTAGALRRLHHSLKTELEQFKRRECQVTWLGESFHHNNPHSIFRWPSVVLLLFEVVAFVVAYSLGGGPVLVGDSLFLICVLALNVILVIWETRLRHMEMRHRAQAMVNTLANTLGHGSGDEAPWSTSDYAPLFQPASPCISLQWAVRDGRLVNVPVHLLVEGDVVVVRPGHQVPGKCSLITKGKEAPLVLEEKETFVPETGIGTCATFTGARLRRPVEPRHFVMLEVPYVKFFRLCLENSLMRPVSMFAKELHHVNSTYLERTVIGILVLTTVLKLAQWRYLGDRAGSVKELVLQPALAILPLLPLSLPALWVGLHALGTARLHLMVAAQEHMAVQRAHDDPFEEGDEVESTHPDGSDLSWGQVQPLFLSLLRGKAPHLWRTSSLLHVLGSVTTLCCVDKKGILSWPNPTPEKVFFLKPPRSRGSNGLAPNFGGSGNIRHSGQLDTGSDIITEDRPTSPGAGDSVLEGGKGLTIDNGPLRRESRLSGYDAPDHMYHPGTHVEVLDLTHSMLSAFGVQFDDPQWKDYINNLKPLGLSILLNTCNPATQEKYARFCDHIACESLHNESAVPVVNKRCLCDLAVQMGFTDRAVEAYQHLQHVALFRHVQPEVVQKGRLARSLNFPRLKMPFPSMCCAVVKEALSGTLQMFTQGTADLVLDMCSEYWDGRDLCPLSDSDRKRILDFYQRSSLTSYCLAFAYAPLLPSLLLNPALEGSYLQLPPDSSHLFRSSGKKVGGAALTLGVASDDKTQSHHLSTDSVSHEEETMAMDAAGREQALEATVERLRNQVFIGMVTMQYQACPDFVKLVEQLEDACIRFVHFSKENELRSRGFSEKMGLESGWNCHVSLLSDRHRTDSNASTCHQSQVSARSVTSVPSSNVAVVAVDPHGVSIVDGKATNAPPRSISAPNLVHSELIGSRYGDSPQSRTSVNRTGNNAEGTVSGDESDPLWTHGDSACPSPSSATESSTDRGAPVAFDISNRAKLPRGIENIRPHIEHVDNVPLLVSLFTDCTPEATLEMVRIMQEYGEVVGCIGSAASLYNLPVFLQADCSIALEPLAPQLCARQLAPSPLPSARVSMTPRALAHTLGSLPCVLSSPREKSLSLYHLIWEVGTHFSQAVRSAMQFLLCCCLSLALVQTLAALVALPPALSPAQLLWLLGALLPALALALVFGSSAHDNPRVMTTATGKSHPRVNRQVVLFFICCYCAKFCPSVLVTLACFALALAHSCQTSGFTPCWPFFSHGGSSEEATGTPAVSWVSGLALCQNVAAFFLVLYFVVISMSFVHRSKPAWKRNPATNRCWLATSLSVLLLQLAFCACNIWARATEPLEVVLPLVPQYVWLTGFLWTLLLLPLNEVVKIHEIRANRRQQKRARLEFGTKLGMNSPF